MMHTIVRRALGMLIFALFMIVIVSEGASASRSIETNTREITAVARALAFTSPESELIRIRCEVTLSITLRSQRIQKLEGVTIGTATVRIAEERCEGGRAEALTEHQPWNVEYISFAGTLPNITSVTLSIHEAEVLVVDGTGAGRCLFRGDIQGVASTNPIRSIRVDETRNIRLFVRLAGALFCPNVGRLTGTFLVTRPAEGVRLTLI